MTTLNRYPISRTIPLKSLLWFNSFLNLLSSLIQPHSYGTASKTHVREPGTIKREKNYLLGRHRGGEACPDYSRNQRIMIPRQNTPVAEAPDKCRSVAAHNEPVQPGPVRTAED